jgi:filamentous hemagglutinin family protein
VKTQHRKTYVWMKRKTMALVIATFFLAFTVYPCPAFSETVQLEGGSVDVDIQGNTTNWNVTGNPVWNVSEFNVAENSIYNISGLTNNASLALLVNGGKASDIFGGINLSNLVFILQNIAGINIGSTGVINLNNASLIASTLPLNFSAKDFLKQNYQFSGQGGFLQTRGISSGQKPTLWP